MHPIDKLLSNTLLHCGLIAILRGIQPHEAAAISRALCDAAFRIVEVLKAWRAVITQPMALVLVGVSSNAILFPLAVGHCSRPKTFCMS